MGRIDADTLYGTLNVLILKAVEQDPLHGLAISRQIRESTEELLAVEEGALYPALHRLQKDGLLRAEWGRSEANRRAKFYSLTDRGRQRLHQEVEKWASHASAVSKALDVSLADS